MNNITAIAYLWLHEAKRLFKSPIFYAAIVILCAIVFNMSDQLFKAPYDTKEEYEKQLGYISYYDLQNYDEDLFFKKIGITDKSKKHIEVFEHTLDLNERAKLSDAKLFHSEQYNDVFNEYVTQGKIFNIKSLTFEQLKSLPENQYNKYKNSIFVPVSCNRASYFYRVTSNNYITNYPTYEEAKVLWEKENMSAHISREYYFRLESRFSLITALLMILSITKDYKYRVNKLIYGTTISPIVYVLTKVSITLIMTCLYLIISVLPAIFYIMSIEPAYWNFHLSDFLDSFFMFVLVPQLFICALSIFISLIAKDWLFSVALSFYYIFLLGAKMTQLPDGLTTWVIYAYKYFPRIPFALGAMELYSSEIFYHNGIYLILSVFLLALSVLIWKKQRVRGEG